MIRPDPSGLESAPALLFVCHANLCRSPMAEALTRWRLHGVLGTDEPPLMVRSAGTHAVPGAPMHPNAVQALREYGLDGTSFRSRVLTADLMSTAGMILTADRRQRGRCVELAPSARSRVFTLRQFARLSRVMPTVGGELRSDDGPAARLADLAERIGAARGRMPPAPAGLDDLPDPVSGPMSGFHACAQELDRLARLLADAMTTGRSASRPSHW